MTETKASVMFLRISKRPWCCMPECEHDAEWVIEYQNDDAPPHDNYAHACTQHIGELLQECHNLVYPIWRGE